MKYILTAGILYFFSVFSFTVTAQSSNELPFFAKNFAPVSFDYQNAYIKIDDKEATYSELLKMPDSSLLRVELYLKKKAVKQFGKDVGKNGVILYTTKKYKAPPSVTTTEDSLEYYKAQGIQPYLKMDTRAALNGDTTGKAWTQFLIKNLRSDVPTEAGAPMGMYTVMIHFAVNEDGSITDISVEEDAGYSTKAEAIRLMSKSPAWQPALYKGKPAKYYVRQPLSFVVMEM